jgi:hypothetical protein
VRRQLPRGTFDQLLAQGTIARLAEECDTWGELAARLGVTKNAFEHYRSRAADRGIVVPMPKGMRYALPDSASDLAVPDDGVNDAFLSEEPTSPGMSIGIIDPLPADFVVRETGTKLDANGDIIQQWQQARRGSDAFEGVRPAIPDGHRVKGLSTLIDESGGVRAQWIKTDVDRDRQREAIFDAIRRLADAWPSRAEPTSGPERADEDLMCVYPFGDPHFGQYSWAAETGDDYDLELAEAYHVTAIDTLVDAAPAAETALIVSLGDLSHADNSSNMTPRSGHILDVDTRRPKIARAITRALRRMVDRALEKHRRCKLWLVPGNHDPESTIMLQIAFGMFYEANQRVEIETSPTIAYYTRFGRNLVGATHSHTAGNRASLGEIMAADRKEDWGETDYRYFYCGHGHHDSVIETRSGVLVEMLRTLAGKDKYAADNFYRSGRDAKCDVLHKTDGRIVRNTVGIRQIMRKLAG